MIYYFTAKQISIQVLLVFICQKTDVTQKMRIRLLTPFSPFLVLVVLASLARGQEYLYSDEFPPIIDPYDDVETSNYGEYPPVIDPYDEMGNKDYYYEEGEVPGFYEEFYNTQPSETTELPYYDYIERLFYFSISLYHLLKCLCSLI